MVLRKNLLCLVGSEVWAVGAMTYGTRLDTVWTSWRYIAEAVCLVLLNKQQHCKINKIFFCFVFLAINFVMSNLMKIQPVVELFHGCRLREQSHCRVMNMCPKVYNYILVQ
jgi:hypothetical protein